MKRVSLLLVMMVTICLSFAAIDDYYTFNATTGTYTAIAGTAVTSIHADDAISETISLGFTFPYGDFSYSEIKISSNGWIGLGTSQTGSNLTNALTSTTVQPVIAPLWDDLNMNAGTVQYLLTGTAPNRIFTIQFENAKWNYNSTTLFNFQARMYETGKIDFIYGAATGAPNSASASIGINMTPGGTGWFYSVTPSTSSASSTTENLSINEFPAQGTVFQFNPVVGVPNDLAAMSITGSTTPANGSVATYTISVRNRGTNPQSTYQVKLFRDAGIELGSVAGTTITPDQIITFDIPWTPTAEGQYSLYGRVVLAGDENPTNDQTPPLLVTVMQSGQTVAEVGNATTTNTSTGTPSPYGTYYKNFKQQYLYTVAELMAVGGHPGPMTSIAFNVQAVNTCLPMPNFTIRMKHTTQTALTTTFEPGDYTTVWVQDNFLPVVGWNTHVFTTPFVWDGASNVIIEIVTSLISVDYTQNASVYYTATTGVNTALRYQSDTLPAIDGTTGTLSVNRANTRFFIQSGGLGSLNGVVYADGAQPLAGASVVIGGTAFATVSNASGAYSFPYLVAGTYQATATKHGYNEVTHTVVINEDQATTQNFTLAQLATVTVTGTVTGSDQPTVGLADATIALSGYEAYQVTTNAAGVFTIPGVYSGHTYDYTITRMGYQSTSGTVTVGATNVNMGTIVINEIALPATGVQAEIAGANVNVTWSEPGTGGGEWITYAGPNNDSIGTGGVADFDVAIRFPASVMADYAGMSLYSIKVWPAQAGSFSVRVWTGGTPTAPAQMVIDQAFTPVLDQYNEVALSTPVPITGTEELWFGYRCNVTSGYPAGSDAGPAIDGFGNMMYWQNAWTTLLALAPSLNYNWNIEGYVGYSAPTLSKIELQPLAFNAERVNTGELKASGIQKLSTSNTENTIRNERVLTGYKVWRFLQGQETNEAAWTLITPAAITATAKVDTDWSTLPDGWYKWAVKAVYTNDVMAPAAFSNALQRLTQVGTIAGIVRRANNVAIPGAVVSAAGYSATTNATGAYSLVVPAGNHTVTATAAGFSPAQQTGVVVVTGQTTAVNFVLQPTGIVLQEGFEGATFPPTGWTQVITDTGAANTYGVTPTWCRVGSVALTPAIVPPEGSYQAGMWWSYNHQDEWLITPQFMCPGAATLEFKSYVFFGSTNQDHYYVKVSTDNGANWTTLWDATAQTGGQQNYASPAISLSLATYAGQNIKLAWHAADPPTNDGMWYVWFIDQVKVEGTVSNEEINAPVVVTALNANYPNPFNPETTISYSVKESAPVSIDIYNVKGQLVKTLVNDVRPAGQHTVVWNGKDNNGRNVTSGVYFYKMSTGKFSSTKKMILMK